MGGVDDPIRERATLKGPFASSLSIISDTRTDEAFKRLSAWLEDCLSNHEDCRTAAANMTLFMPTRVLDLAQAIKDKAVMIATAQLPQPAPYACLSYCWGSELDGVVRTVKTNLKENQTTGIPLCKLPQTIQDAATVCAKLGIRYLWIDSLCIIQDDGDDWAREAMQMCNVYSHSRLTIAAHRAAACKEGFLGKQIYGQPDWQREVKTDFGKAIPDANPEKVFLRLEESDFRSRAHDPSPLETRGWTLQECILPPRIIHYTAEELVWECNTRHFCECGHVEGLTTNGTFPMVRTEIARGKGNDKIKELAVDGWMHLVERYSERNLTFLSDKIPAIAGLAQMVQASIPATEDSTYLAGLFLRSLPRHLLWTVKSKKRGSAYRPATARSVPPRAPTWSWASVDNPVSYPRMLVDLRDREYVTVHREGCFATPPDGASSQGAGTTVGELLLEGPVVPVKLMTVESPEQQQRQQSPEGSSDSWMSRLTFAWTRNGRRAKVICDVARDFDVKADRDGHDCWTCWTATNGHRCDECNLRYAPRDTTECIALKVGMYCVPSDRQRLFLVLGRSRTVEGAWERLGVGSVRVDYEDVEAEWELFDQAEVRKVRIV